MTSSNDIKRGLFYFINEDLCRLYPNAGLMNLSKGQMQDRPCLCVAISHSGNVFWMVPISSKTDKYRTIYRNKMAKRGVCDTLVFGNVLDSEKTFLIQNIFPVTAEFITGLYISKNGIPVLMEQDLMMEIISKSHKVMSLEKHGIRIAFTDIFHMLDILVPEPMACLEEERVFA